MNSVERVKKLCKEKKIPISKLEKELEFSNGYIGQLKRGVLPDDRLRKIANFLGVSVEYLMTGKDDTKEKSPDNKFRYDMDTEAEIDNDPDIRRIQRARQKMPPQEKDFMMAMLKRSFSQYFEDDGSDDPD